MSIFKYLRYREDINCSLKIQLFPRWEQYLVDPSPKGTMTSAFYLGVPREHKATSAAPVHGEESVRGNRDANPLASASKSFTAG